MSDQKQLPSDFDWVTARRACSAMAFFERLAAGARKNVQTRKDMRMELNDLGPVDLAVSHPGEFSITRGITPGKYAVVRFWLDGERIAVEGKGVDVNFDGRLTLNDAGQCRLKVAGQELDEWQVLRRALEQLFFGF